MLDFSKPMMIRGMPETTVLYSCVSDIDGHNEGVVKRDGLDTWISFRDNGWITSTTYATDKVVNVDTQAMENAREGAYVAGDLWGSF